MYVCMYVCMYVYIYIYLLIALVKVLIPRLTESPEPEHPLNLQGPITVIQAPGDPPPREQALRTVLKETRSGKRSLKSSGLGFGVQGCLGFRV